MPKFTIGIPTFNRALLLEEALNTALGQTSKEVTVVVVDNGSRDRTTELLKNYRGRIKVIRNENNLGPLPAFRQCIEASETPFFSWLQDDDLIHPELIMRATKAFESFPQASLYLPFAAYSDSRRNLSSCGLYGPPFDFDWRKGRCMSLVEPRDLWAMSFFCSVSIPPVLIGRREALYEGLSNVDASAPLYAERTLLNFTATHGPAVIDSFIGGLYYKHPGQVSEASRDQNNVLLDWRHMATLADKLLGSDFQEATFRDLLKSLTTDTVYSWKQTSYKLQDHRLPNFSLACKALADEADRRNLSVPNPYLPAKCTFMGRIKDVARGLTPPLLWEYLGKLRAKRRFAKEG